MVHSFPIIIFVDRDFAWSQEIRKQLQARGARVFTTDSRRELNEMIDRSMPDLVVLGGDATDASVDAVLEFVRNRCPNSSLVLFSTQRTGSLEQVSRVLGLLYYGEKPADPQVLMDVIVSAFPGRLREPGARARRAALVMCVDDDPLYLRSLDRILTHHGYRVVGFEDPEQALEAVAETRPDLAIIDIMMPKMNGLNLADEIREGYGGRVPIVLLTARGSDEDILEGYRHGVAYYVTKPCAPKTVLNIVDYLVGGLDKTERERLEAEL